ncbi:hypothetical protein PLESTB_000835200 [Pleodorina starrii]|uniref:CASTOR/POLLUX/SYM8 ion channel conserved domain-containing protein n=1 Tax=Pleodorina starrii TaxID=330485 RepID=A0A9W6F389_9CHLO|nr:hypothetical protein PLESTB_000835200 [Pleodorina starrii]GLC64487.1 hypothetical protein PLESTF_000171500 [Pleodorina starrii]
MQNGKPTVASPKAPASFLCFFMHGPLLQRCDRTGTLHATAQPLGGPRWGHARVPPCMLHPRCKPKPRGLPTQHAITSPQPHDITKIPWRHHIGQLGVAATSVAAVLATALAIRAAGGTASIWPTPFQPAAAAVAPEAPAFFQPLRPTARRHVALASVSASHSLSALPLVMASLYDFVSYANYKIMQAMTFPTLGKLLTVVAVSFLIWLVGSWALSSWTNLRPKEAMLRCYLMLNNVPGADITGEKDVRTALLLNLMYTVGLLTFAALIGLLGDDIKGAVEAARLGNFRVPERNHTVVLGHNRQLVEVLRQVALVRADRGAAAFPGQLVVLSDRDRASLEEFLLDALGPAAAAGVVTRQGSPLKVADLQRVSAGHARTVILLAPEANGGSGGGGEEQRGGGGAGDAAAEDADADGAAACLGLSMEARQSVTLAALHHLRQQALQGPGGGRLGSEPQTVVVQHDADLDLLDPDVFARGGIDGGGGAAGGPAPSRHLVTPVSHLNSLSRIQAQCAAQPGLSVVMSSIMQQQPGMPEFYVHRVPEVVGLKYGDARRLFPRAVLCGVYDPAAATAFATNSAEARLDALAKAVVLNPADSMPLLERYSLVLLADRTADLNISHARLHELAASNRSQDASGAAAPAQLEQAQQGRDRSHVHRSFPSSLFRRQNAAGGGGGGGGGGRGVAAPGTRAERGAAPLRVVLLVFNGQQPEELLEGLADYCPPGSEAVVVARKDTAASRGPPNSLQQQRRLRVLTVASDPRIRGSLREAGVHEADAVILTGLEGVSTDQADAQALATLIQLQALMPQLPPATATATGATKTTSSDTASDTPSQSTAGSDTGSDPMLAARPPLNMVCGVTDPRVRDIMNSLVQVQPGGSSRGGGGGLGVARRQLTIETINSDELLAGVLTQVAAEPRLSGLFHELSTAEGMEVHLRTPAALELPYNQPLTWDQVQEAGREREVTVIGLLHAAGEDATQPRLLLGVPLRPAGAAMEFRPGDKVVVLSSD